MVAGDDIQRPLLFFQMLVPRTGIEPAHPFGHQILSLTRLLTSLVLATNDLVAQDPVSSGHSHNQTDPCAMSDGYPTFLFGLPFSERSMKYVRKTLKKRKIMKKARFFLSIAF